MYRIRLTISIVALIAVVIFGLTTSTFQVAKADDLVPTCNCYSTSGKFYGMLCNSSGGQTPYGNQCCTFECDRSLPAD